MARRRNRVAKRGAVPFTPKPYVPYDAYSGLRSRLVSVRPVDLSLYEDRRRFHPERAYRPALSFSRKSSSVVKLKPTPVAKRRNKPVYFMPPDVLAFTNPLKVLLCVRRKERREVLLAKGLHRKGAGGAKHRNWWSDIKC